MRPEQPSDPARLHVRRANQMTLAYTEEGEGATTIVAIPGLPGTSRDFRWIAPALVDDMGRKEKGVRLLRLDLPGYGESERRGYAAMTIEERADVVLEFLDLMQLEQVVLMGHSSGCTVAAQLAVAHPERVSRVVFIAPPGPMAHYAVDSYKWLNLLLLLAPTRTLMKPVLSYIFARSGFPSYLSDDERIYSSLDAGAKNFTTHAHNLEQMRQPTLVAWAKDDRVIPPRFIEPLVARVPKGPRLCFEKGGHNIQKTQAIEIAQAVSRMLGLEENEGGEEE